MSSHDPSRSTGFAASTEPPAMVVTHCPFCHSDRVANASKSTTPDSYWRCQGCGEMWNPGREAQNQRLRPDAWRRVR
jgi:transposase-like protein